MPVLSVYIDERTQAILEARAKLTSRTVEDLAEAAVESAALDQERRNELKATMI